MDSQIFALLCEMLPPELVEIIGDFLLKSYRYEVVSTITEIVGKNISEKETHDPLKILDGTIFLTFYDYCAICGEFDYDIVHTFLRDQNRFVDAANISPAARCKCQI